MSRSPFFTPAIAVLTAIVFCLAAVSDATAADPTRFDKTIAGFEAADAKKQPPTGGILFTGSSSIRKWDLEKYFPGAGYLNRGFGGSHISDCIHFAPRIVLPYKPHTIVFYAGDNDTASGKSPEVVERDFKKFVAIVHKQLPECRIVFIAIKPSIARWKLIKTIRQANSLVEAVCNSDKRLSYVDVDKPMLDASGEPRADLLAKDNLHLSPAGYVLWTSLVKPQLPVSVKVDAGK